MGEYQTAVERLIRQVEARVALKDELRWTARGIATTLLILAAVLALLFAVVGGAVIFATLVEVLAR